MVFMVFVVSWFATVTDPLQGDFRLKLLKNLKIQWAQAGNNPELAAADPDKGIRFSF